MPTKNIVIACEDGPHRRSLISKLVSAGYRVSAHAREYLMQPPVAGQSPYVLLVVLNPTDSCLTLKKIFDESADRDVPVVFTGDKTTNKELRAEIAAHNHIFIPIESTARELSLVLGTASLMIQDNSRAQSLRKIRWAISAFGRITKTENEPQKALKGILGALSTVTQSRCDIVSTPHNIPSGLQHTDKNDGYMYTLDRQGLWQLSGRPKQNQKFDDGDIQIFMMAGAICSRLI
jgi:hypothetical protein